MLPRTSVLKLWIIWMVGMKRTWLPLAAIVVLCTLSSYAQTEPNLETGIKPYGTYHGSAIDTVDNMNGNVMVTIPFPADYPQRGTIHDAMVLTFHAKGWHLIGGSGTNNMFWAADRSLMGGTDGLSPLHTRTMTLFTSNGVTEESIAAQGLMTPDGSTHPIMDTSPNGDGTSYETIDGSGWHIIMSNPDQYGGFQSGVL